MHLTDVQRSIERIRDLPVHRRPAEARSLIPALDEALTGVAPETAIRLWMKLSRFGTGRAVTLDQLGSPTGEAARTLAVACLDGGDPIAAVTEARAADEEAQAVAARARRGLMQAVGDGRRSGVTVDRLMASAGVSRQTVYDWERETAPPDGAQEG